MTWNSLITLFPTSKDADNSDPVDDQPNKTGEKFKDMLQQLDRMILDKQEEMNEAKELRSENMVN